MTSVRSARDTAYDALQEFSRLSTLLLSSIVDVAEQREGPNPEEIMKQLLEADKRLQVAVHSRMYPLELLKLPNSEGRASIS